MVHEDWNIPEPFKKNWRHIALLSLVLPGVAYLAGRRWRRFLLLCAFFAAAWLFYAIPVVLFGASLSGNFLVLLWAMKWMLYASAYAFQGVEAFRAL